MTDFCEIHPPATKSCFCLPESTHLLCSSWSSTLTVERASDAECIAKYVTCSDNIYMRLGLVVTLNPSLGHKAATENTIYHNLKCICATTQNDTDKENH